MKGMEGRATSMAISCMWAWMIPQFYIEYTEYRLALNKVRMMAWDVVVDGQENTNTKRSSAIDTAKKATVEGVCWAIGIIGIVYVGSAVAIGELTGEPDQSVLTKPDAISVGVGRMLSAGLLAYFSVEFPKWLGISYSSQKQVKCYKHVTLVNNNSSSSSSNKKDLSFRVCWSLLGHFFIFYPFLLTYFCNESIAYIALSTGVGIFCGFAVVYFIWLGHTKLNIKHRTRLAIVLSLFIAMSSAAAFSAGCWYVKEVWLDHDEYTGEYAIATFFVWFALCLLSHYLLLVRLTERKLAEAKVAAEADHATLVTLEVSEGSMKGAWRYTSEVFQPPKSINCMATELSKPFSSLPALMRRFRRLDQHSNLDDTRKADNTIRIILCNGDKLSSQSPPVQQHQTNDGIGNGNDNDNEIIVVAGDEEVGNHNAVLPSNFQTTPDSSSPEKSDIETQEKVIVHPNSAQDNVDSIDDDAAVSSSIDQHHHNILHNSNNDDSIDISSLSLRSTTEESDEQRETTVIPTLWSMIRNNSCCRKRRHYDAPLKKGWNKWATIFKWTLWTLACSWHVSFTLVNIGASHQRNKVRRALFGTYDTLYPDSYNTGAMCAWNEASSIADIRTFDSMQDVNDAKYTVIHCGECGNCSNWNDLSLQWTTRNHLAKKAKECVTKSILGSREEVQKCNEDSIGFSKECSLCWTDDEYCARDNCMFIFLQSVFTNQVNNFNVGPDDITSATCDEALCGPRFVPCSGATRRRMNIVSDIPRPVSQQCRVAVEDWSVIFDHA